MMRIEDECVPLQFTLTHSGHGGSDSVGELCSLDWYL